MVRPSAVTVRRRAPRVLATLGVLVAAVLALSTVTTAPSADAATVLGQFRNAAGRCLENLNNATTANNKIQINACGTATNQAQQFSRWTVDESIKTPAGRCLGTLNNATAAGTSVVLQACNPALQTQHWVVRTDGLVVNRQAVRCLAPLNNSATSGTRMVIAACTTSTAMRWSVPAASTPTVPPTTTTTRPTTTTTTPTTTTTVPPTTTTTTTPPPAGRDPIRQPFASNSIWNMPIGSGAVYRPANLPALPGGSTGARVPQVDDEPLVLTPTAPLTPILASPGGWGGNRCVTNPTTLATVPIPVELRPAQRQQEPERRVPRRRRAHGRADPAPGPVRGGRPGDELRADRRPGHLRPRRPRLARRLGHERARRLDPRRRAPAGQPRVRATP